VHYSILSNYCKQRSDFLHITPGGGTSKQTHSMKGIRKINRNSRNKRLKASYSALADIFMVLPSWFNNLVLLH
ncbi:MAG: hypothetical protein Q4A74_04465, partial [Cardiobacteriaceae bacterium]|nr:hypothetical protein [Cardiobacteriaceae bacterium]